MSTGMHLESSAISPIAIAFKKLLRHSSTTKPVNLVDIHKAYRTLAAKVHPDVCPANERVAATLAFRELKEVYEEMKRANARLRFTDKFNYSGPTFAETDNVQQTVEKVLNSLELREKEFRTHMLNEKVAKMLHLWPDKEQVRGFFFSNFIPSLHLSFLKSKVPSELFAFLDEASRSEPLTKRDCVKEVKMEIEALWPNLQQVNGLLSKLSLIQLEMLGAAISVEHRQLKNFVNRFHHDQCLKWISKSQTDVLDAVRKIKTSWPNLEIAHQTLQDLPLASCRREVVEQLPSTIRRELQSQTCEAFAHKAQSVHQ